MLNKITSILIIIFMATPISAETDGLIDLKTQEPILSPSTQTVVSSFVGLTDEALEQGFDELKMKGNIKYQHLKNKKIRVVINWHTIKKSLGALELSERINGKLTSSFITTSKMINVNTKISAQGNTDALTEAVTRLEANHNKKNPLNKKKGENNETTKTGENTKNSNTLADPTGGLADLGAGAGSEAPAEVSEGGAKLKATSYEACAPLISKADGIVYAQAIKVVTIETGEELERSQCIKYGSTAPILKEYDVNKCGVQIDIGSQLVFEKYSEYATLDGTRIEVSGCEVDQNKSRALDTTSEVVALCGARIDRDLNYAYEQGLIKVTAENGATVSTSDCEDTGVRASITKDYNLEVCGVEYDTVNLKVYEKFREFAILNDKRYEISGCQTDTNKQRALNTTSEYTSYCDVRIDEANDMLYQQGIEVVTSENGVVVSTSACQDTGIQGAITKNYDLARCGLEYDIPNSKVYEKYYSSAVLDGATFEVTNCLTDTSKQRPLVINTTWETSCDVRIDAGAGFVYTQAVEVTTSENNVELTRSACQDHGSTAAIEREYLGSCGVFIDVAAGFVFKKYKELAILDGATIDVTGCTTDRDFEPFPVVSTFEGCPIYDDFVNGHSMQKKQNYYIDETTTRIDINTCVDSTETYPHFLTDLTCTAIFDDATDKVFIQKRTAYYDATSTVAFASDCAPIDTNGTSVITEFCSPKYEHDYNGGVSYYTKSSYYFDDAAQKVTVGACGRDTSISFTHQKTQAGCSVTNDDANLRTTLKAKTFIITPDDGSINLTGCEPLGNPIPYSYLGISYTYVSPNWGASDFNGNPIPNCYITPNGSTWESQLGGTCLLTGAADSVPSSGCVIILSWNGHHYAYMHIWDRNESYLRGDGSTYNVAGERLDRVCGPVVTL